MSQINFQSLILNHVSATVRKGGAVDVCAMAEHLKPIGGRMSLDDIKSQVLQAVAVAGGGAAWDRRSGGEQ